MNVNQGNACNRRKIDVKKGIYFLRFGVDISE